MPPKTRFLPALLTAVALAATTLTTVATASPAHAAVSGTTSTGDVTLGNSCRRIPIDYRISVDPGTTQWQLRINVESPNDDAPEGFDLSSDDGDELQGTLRHLICGSDRPGTYTIRGFGTYQVGLPLANSKFELADSSFTVRRSPTRTAVGTDRINGGRHRVVGTVKAFRKGKFRRVSNSPVRLQRKVDGRWRNLTGTKLTNSGRAKFVVRVPRGTRVRAVTVAQGFRGKSVSRAVRLR